MYDTGSARQELSFHIGRGKRTKRRLAKAGPKEKAAPLEAAAGARHTLTGT